MFHLPQILTTAELSELRDLAMRAPWLDGRITAGASAAEKQALYSGTAARVYRLTVP